MSNNIDLFGGIPVALGRDFAQILPVVKIEGRVQIANACVRLKVKIGTPNLLVRNYYSKLRLCNHTQFIIIRIFDHFIRGHLISPDPRYNYQDRMVAPMTITSSEGLPLTRKQPQLRPSYFMAINWSQWRTL